MSKNFIIQLLNFLGFCSLLAGGFGMLFSLQFLLSGKIEDLVGAGFSFVAGSILFGTGLLTLAVLNRKSS